MAKGKLRKRENGELLFLRSLFLKNIEITKNISAVVNYCWLITRKPEIVSYR